MAFHPTSPEANHGGGGPSRDRSGGWGGLWARMSHDERHRAAEGYLEDAEKHPNAVEAAIRYVAVEAKTRTLVVRRWSRSQRAARLARLRGHPTPYLHTFVASFHRHRRAPMLARFLDVAAIPHAAGHVDVATSHEPAPIERLVTAVEAISAEFPPAEVSLYLDALELEAERPWSHLVEARRLVEEGHSRGLEPKDGASA